MGDICISNSKSYLIDSSFLFNDVTEVLSVFVLRILWIVLGFDVFHFSKASLKAVAPHIFV